MGKQQVRHGWIDAARGLAVLLVVVQHAVTIPEGSGLEPWRSLGTFNGVLSPFRIPLLLVMSGMLLERSLAKPLPRYVSGKIRGIVWPLLLWTPVVWVFRPPTPGVLASYFGPAHLWYLATLAFCYAGGLLTKRVNALLLSIAVVATAHLGVVPGQVFAWWWFSAFFLFGAWLVRHTRAVQRLPKWLGVVMLVCALAWGLLEWTSPWKDHPLSFPMSIVGVLGLLWLAPKLPRMSLLEWVGRNSIVFYVAHAPLMWLFIASGGAGFLRGGPAVSLAMIVVGLAGSLFLVSPKLRWLFVLPRRRG